MKRILIPTLPSVGGDVEIPEEEAHHLIQVLRIRNGEVIEALDGQGYRQSVEVRLQGKNRVLVHGLKDKETSSEFLGLPIRLEMAVLKGDAMEWTVEKAVELGVKFFQPVLSAHSVVQIDKKGPRAFQERWQKIADQSLKQCGRLDRMTVYEPKDLGMVLQSPSSRFWLNERNRKGESLSAFFSKNISKDLISILVGPEGGWSETELSFLSRSGAIETSLGPWVLRAETAAVFATSLAVGCMR